MKSTPTWKQIEQELGSIPAVVSASYIKPTDVRVREQMEKSLGEKRAALAVKRAKTVYAFEIVYKSKGAKVSGFVMISKKHTKEISLPALIFNRGGTQAFGAIDYGLLFFRLPVCANWGYAVFASQYTGGPGSEGKDEWGGQDLDSVLTLKHIITKWERSNEKKIGMYGGSRGVYMMYHALAKVKWIKAAIALAGPVDLEWGVSWRPEMLRVYQEAFGDDKKTLVQRSPINLVAQFHKKTPILLLHGTTDWRVHPREALTMSKALLDAEHPHRLVMFEGGTHGLIEHWKERDALIENWLERFVKNGEAMPVMKITKSKRKK